MLRRIFVAAALIALGSTASSQTQQNTPGTDKPNTSSQPATISQPTTPVQKKDIYWIGPKKQDKPKKPAKPSGSGHLMPPGEMLKAIRPASPGAAPNASPVRVADRRSNKATPVMTDVGGSHWTGAQAQSQSASGNIAVAEIQGPRKGTYLIQFKPGVTAKQRNDLLRRYGLTIENSRESLNIYVVSGGPPIPPGAELIDVFNPPMIKKLRAESIIANATVDNAYQSRSIPKSSSLKVKDDHGITYQWDWKSYAVAAPTPTDLSAAARPPALDGNWGLKSIRMPPVWTIVQRFRANPPKPDAPPRPKLAIIDTGFSEHANLKTMNLLPAQNVEGANVFVASNTPQGDPCRASHGNHVAGIVGATWGEGIGTDGIIPDVKMDAVPVSDNLMKDDAAAGEASEHLLKRNQFFSEVLFAASDYMSSERALRKELRVVNISMDLNIRDFLELNYPIEDIKAAIKDTLRSQAQMFNLAMLKYEKAVLIVTSAGNDSELLDTPLEAKWASSLIWLAKANANEFDKVKRAKNILVVEAVDRSGQRAAFSNVSGDIAGPGVDILSTLAKGEKPYGLCDGTSMAAPHAAAIATLMFELAPDKTPEQIIDIMTRSATPKPAGAIGAPRLDALESVLNLSPYKDSRNENLVRLTDLNGDGKIDSLDMQEFARRLAMVTDNRANGTAFTADLNEDKATDVNECNWPVIDFNGSGIASLAHNDVKRVLGEYRNDLAVMQMAWTDKTKDSATAMKETGLDAAIVAADKANQAVSPQACR